MSRRKVETLQTPPLTRTATDVGWTRAAGDDAEESRVREFALASEFQVERFFGTEILEVSSRAIRVDRVDNGVAPLLMDHQPSDQVGRIESVSIGADRVVRGRVRFGRSARASEALADVDDGIRTAVSIGYRVHRMELVESDSESGDTFRVTDWELFEASLVSVPADPSVGVGRDASDRTTIRTEVVRTEEGIPMRVLHRQSGQVIEIEESEFDASLHHRLAEPAPENGQSSPTSATTTPPPHAGGTVRASETPEDVERRARESERERISHLEELGRQYGVARDRVESAVRDGWGVERFLGELRLDRAREGRGLTRPATELDLSARDVQTFSLMRLIRAMTRHATASEREAAGLELETSRTIAERLGREPRGAFVPYDVLSRSAWAPPELQQRAPAGVAQPNTQGAGLVGTDHLAGSFIEILRNRSAVVRMGATVLPGLVGDVSIPRQTGSASAAWVAENAGSGDTPINTGNVALTPKTVRARSDVTRKMLLQSSPGVEMLVRMDLTRVSGLAIDAGALNGAGAPAPLGVLQTIGVGSVTIDATDALSEFRSVIEFESDVAAANADVGELGYLTTPEMRGRWKGLPRDAGSGIMIWTGGNGIPGQSSPGELNGYPAMATNQIPKDLGGGSDAHGVVFGYWPDLLIGEWGTLDLQIDEITLADSGGLVLRSFQDVDTALRHAVAFAVGSLNPAA